MVESVDKRLFHILLRFNLTVQTLYGLSGVIRVIIKQKKPIHSGRFRIMCITHEGWFYYFSYIL